MLSWTWQATWFCLSRLMFAVTECLCIRVKNQGSLAYAISWHVKKSLPPPTHSSQDTMQQVDERHVMWGCFGKMRQQWTKEDSGKAAVILPPTFMGELIFLAGVWDLLGFANHIYKQAKNIYTCWQKKKKKKGKQLNLSKQWIVSHNGTFGYVGKSSHKAYIGVIYYLIASCMQFCELPSAVSI